MRPSHSLSHGDAQQVNGVLTALAIDNVLPAPLSSLAASLVTDFQSTQLIPPLGRPMARKDR